jgi:hypothetical protein
MSVNTKLELMEFACPHCQKPGLSMVAKLLSDPAAPARCRLCGGLSHKHQSIVLLANVLVTPALFASVLASLHFSSPWPLITLGGVLFAYPLLVLSIPATTISSNSSMRARRSYLLGFALLVVSVGLYAVFRT